MKTSQAALWAVHLIQAVPCTFGELTHLPAEVLQLHLSPWHLIIIEKVTVACRLYKALYPTNTICYTLYNCWFGYCSSVTSLSSTSASFNGSPEHTLSLYQNCHLVATQWLSPLDHVKSQPHLPVATKQLTFSRQEAITTAHLLVL